MDHDMRRFESALLKNIHDVIFATDPDGFIIYWNSLAEDMFGWPAEETLGRSAYWLFVPLVGRRTCLTVARRLATSGGFVGKIDCRGPDGRSIHTDVQAQLITASPEQAPFAVSPLGAVFSIREIASARCRAG